MKVISFIWQITSTFLLTLCIAILSILMGFVSAVNDIWDYRIGAKAIWRKHFGN